MRKAYTLIELIITVAIILVVLGALSALFSGCSTASDGYRDGYIQKLSHKRQYVWHTWEGEMALPGYKGSGGNVFTFTVSNDELRKFIESDVDAETFVRLHYKQYIWNWPWNGGPYFAEKVDVKRKNQ